MQWFNAAADGNSRGSSSGTNGSYGRSYGSGNNNRNRNSNPQPTTNSGRRSRPGSWSQSDQQSQGGKRAGSEVVMQVDPGLMGKIVGPRGATLKELQDQFNVTIKVPQRGSTSTTVRILGRPEECEACKVELYFITDQEEAPLAIPVPSNRKSEGEAPPKSGGSAPAPPKSGGSAPSPASAPSSGGGGGNTEGGGGGQRRGRRQIDLGANEAVVVVPNMAPLMDNEDFISKVQEIQESTGAEVKVDGKVVPKRQSVYDSDAPLTPFKPKGGQKRFLFFDEQGSSLQVTPPSSVSQLTTLGISYCGWQGGRTNIGVNRGKVGFAIHVGTGSLARIGWGTRDCNLNLGTCSEGFGYGATGKKSNCNKFTSYGRTFKAGDTVLALIDFNGGREHGRTRPTISYHLNGEDLGQAFLVNLGNFVGPVPEMLPTVALKDTSVEVVLGGEGRVKLPEGYQWVMEAANAIPCNRPARPIESGGQVGKPVPVQHITVQGSSPDDANLVRVHIQNILHIDTSRPTAPPQESNLLYPCTPDMIENIQRLWRERGGRGSLENVWQIRNNYLKHQFESKKIEMERVLGQRPDQLEGFHGTPAGNVLGISQKGFLEDKRRAEVYGRGNYFAKDPNVSIGYCKGVGNFMLICRLQLGVMAKDNNCDTGDHIWVPSNQYYVIPDPGQILPLYVVEFSPSDNRDRDISRLRRMVNRSQGQSERRKTETGAMRPGAYHRKCSMVLDSTREIWVGFLEPSLTDAALEEDVKKWLDLPVSQVVIEHESLRRGAWVLLKKPISREQVLKLNEKTYHGRFTLCVEDIQKDSPPVRDTICPRLKGRGRYCRMASMQHLHRPCRFTHPPMWIPTHFAEHALFPLDPTTAKFEELSKGFMGSAGKFHNGSPRILGISKIVNHTLSNLYEERKRYQDSKHANPGAEVELYHGTSCAILPHLYTHGLAVPSDTQASPACPRSGGRGLCTTLCDNRCEHCKEPHKWSRCHMFGLGIYLADSADKSHRYVKKVEGQDHKIILCRVALGQSFVIKGHLKDGSALHDVTIPKDYSKHIIPEDSDHYESSGPKGKEEEVTADADYESITAVGLGSRAREGRSVVNSEYIVFTPWQVLPLYEITYALR